MRVLIVEDDPILADGLAVGLKIHGISAEVVGSCGVGEPERAASLWKTRGRVFPSMNSRWSCSASIGAESNTTTEAGWVWRLRKLRLRTFAKAKSS